MKMSTDYQIIAKIYESANSLVYRATYSQNRQPIVLKVLKEDYPSPSALTRYQQEYNVICSLSLDGVVKAYDFQRYQNSFAILLEDFGGESLRKLMSQQQFTLEECLNIVIKIVESLANIHAANVIHKDLNPANIVYNLETEQLKIIDFGLSTVLSRENQAIRNPNQLEGTLPYISPEQTGRMHRFIDYRTDYYSLGITFYELLTHRLPFETEDPMELVHFHLAKQPIPPDQYGIGIPLSVSNIAMKLLAKNPEDRYQSAWGITADLQNCIHQIQNHNQISYFSIASQDVCDKFQISQKLYGRDLEIDQLLSAFEKVSQGFTQMVLVAGYSGVGKSVLVNEIHKPIVQKRGYFSSGKFDQLKRNIPYASLTQAFQELIRQLLTENELALQAWKTKLITALGTNAQVIIDIIPEVEMIIGKQLPVPQLPPAESQNRFNLVLQKFIEVFARPEHPLVIFLDDLQWADSASLKLIDLLITNPDSQYLLIIGAYRDNEVSATHPLMLTLEKMHSDGVKSTSISLQALKVEHVNQLVADTLNCSTEQAQPLAELMLHKTNGNAFFLTQFFQSLYTEDLLSFDYDCGFWQWDIEKIKSREITNNVIELMVGKLEKLDENTQNVLKLAACVGNRFNLDVIAFVNSKSSEVTAQELWPALQKGLIVPMSDNYKIPLLWSQETNLGTSLSSTVNISESIEFRFLHDRVQQAAYAMIPKDYKQETHLKVGQLLLENTKPHELEENIFDIVNQLNISATLISTQSERDELAGLNLTAARKAKASAAYAPALSYLETSLELLRPDSWQQQYYLTLDIYVEAVEAKYLNTQFAEAESISEMIRNQAMTLLDVVKVYKLNIQSYIAQQQYQEAIDTALKILAELGLSLPKEPSKERLEKEQREIESFLNERPIEELINLPEMVEEDKLVATQILLSITGATIVTHPKLYPLVTLTAVNLCLRYGNPSQAAGVYVFYGGLLCGIGENIDAGYRFGKLSLALSEKSNDSKILVGHFYHAYIQHWKEPLKHAMELALSGINLGLENGNYEFAAYNAGSYCLMFLLTGFNLEKVEQKYAEYTALVTKIKQDYPFTYIRVWRQIPFYLLQEVPAQDYWLDGSQETEETEVNKWIEENNEWLLTSLYLAKGILYYLFKKYDQCLKNIEKSNKFTASKPYIDSVPRNYYDSLGMLALYSKSSQENQNKLLEKISKNQEKLNSWAMHCKENCQHKYDLVEAEKARVLGQYWKAEEFYEKSIEGAKLHEFTQEEAIAYERAAEFYLSLGREDIGKLYLRNAYHCYSRWSAKAKVQSLESEYFDFLTNITARKPNQSINITESTGSNSQALDLIAITKASQVLASEIRLDKLLVKLMKTVIENGGANKGFLLLEKNNTWAIEAEGSVGSDSLNILRSIPIDSVSNDLQTPILPVSIINYVTRTQENVVLGNAIDEGQFTLDPYIIATQAKSILCIPLSNQAKLNGILYLENDLATNAFTNERIEVLKILSAQAAISIENSRLYEQLEDYSRTLEQKVEERTKELSQTLDILKATQAELVFENDLLRSTDQPSGYDYQVGGSLSIDATTYVVRSADREIYKSLKQGHFCYVLNARQMGKSSLMIRMMNHLQQEGHRCAIVDITGIGSDEVTLAQWYKGLALELWQSFELMGDIRLGSWWKERKELSVIHRLGQFFDEILTILGEKLEQEDRRLIIFFDEIDNVFSLNFPVNDFFALLRSIYNQRAINPLYKRLSFALFGVASPSDLITDHLRTPFNIGQLIELNGFQAHEAQPLLYGLSEKVENPQTLLNEVISWTGGQPFLTQKVCQMIRETKVSIPINTEAEWVENLVQTRILDHWEAQDDPQHLKTIRDRILRAPQAPEVLALYQRILAEGQVATVDSPAERELLLSGIISKQLGSLKIYNRIYHTIFDQAWVTAQQAKHQPPSTDIEQNTADITGM